MRQFIRYLILRFQNTFDANYRLQADNFSINQSFPPYHYACLLLTICNGRVDRHFFQVTPYGSCLSKFSRPENKVFVRRFDNCNIQGAKNHSLLPLTNQKYEQSVTYRQNVKVLTGDFGFAFFCSQINFSGIYSHLHFRLTLILLKSP